MILPSMLVGVMWFVDPFVCDSNGTGRVLLFGVSVVPDTDTNTECPLLTTRPPCPA